MTILLFSIFIAIWFFASKGTLFVTILAAILLYILGVKIKEPRQRKIVITICAIAMALRFFMAASNYYCSYFAGKGADFMGDARAYSASGQYVAEVLTGKPMPTVDGNEPQWLVSLRHIYKGEILVTGYRMETFARYIGLIYSTLGYAPITVKFINSLLSVFAGILLFLFVKDMFSIKVANIVLALSLFWPSIFLWSATGTKDSLTFFLIVLSIFIFSKLIKAINISEFLLLLAILAVPSYTINVLFFIALFLIRIFRKLILKDKISLRIFGPLALMFILKIALELLRGIRLHIFLPLLVAFCLSAISFLSKRELVASLIILLCAGLFLPLYMQRIDVNKYAAPVIREAINTQKSQLYAAKSGYKIYPERFYNTRSGSNITDITALELTVSYLKGLGYALFSPFPWSINNKMEFFVSFQMIIYYILTPFIFLGFLIALRYKWRQMLSMMIFIILIISMYALHEGNVGTVFRHRDILMIFFFVFAAIGIGKTLGYIDKSQFKYAVLQK